MKKLETMASGTWLALALILATVPACGGGDGKSAAGDRGGATAADPALPEGAEVYTVRGVFQGPAFDGRAMQVDHEAIPDHMDAMSMAFRLRDPAQIEGLAAGDKISFRYVFDGVDSYADRVEPLPAETELQLAGGGS